MVRTGGSRVFFDVVGRMQADRMISDAHMHFTVMKAVGLDAMGGIHDSIVQMTEAIKEATAEFEGLSLAMTEARITFEKFYGASREDLAGLEQQIIDMGAAYGFVGEEALAAGARVAQLKQIVGAAAVGEVTELGIQFALIGGMETEDAQRRFINLQQQTNFMLGEYTRAQYDALSADQQRATVSKNSLAVLDQLNSIENTSVATMSQIIFVMNQYAAQAHLTGESITQMAAQSAALIEAGEEQGKAGRAMRMIYARLGSNIGGARDHMEQFAQVTDETTGAVLPLSKIIDNLGPTWDRMATSEKQALAQAVSGNRHYVRFIKLMENRNRVTELAKNANEALFPALEEVERYTKDGAYQLKILNAELENQKRILSEELTPAMIGQKEIYISFNKALNDIVASAPGLGKVMMSFVAFYDIFGGMFGGLLNMQSMLIAMSLAIGLQRQLAANAQIYVKTIKQGTSQIQLQNLNKKEQYEIAKHILELDRLIAGQEQQKGIHQGVFNALSTKEMNIKFMIAELNKQVDLSLSRQQVKQGMIADRLKQGAAAAQHELQIIRNKSEYEAITARLRNVDLHTLQTRSLYLQGELEKQQIYLKNKMIELAQEGSLTKVQKEHVEVSKFQNKLNEEELLQIEMYLQKRKALKGLDSAMKAEMQNRTQVKKTLVHLENASNEAIGRSLQSQGLLTNVERKLTKAEAERAGVLARLNYRVEELTIAQQKQAMASEASRKAMQRSQAALSGYSMVLGTASMAMMMLSNVLGLDPEKSMKASMMLMTASMIPAMYQMVMMTKQMGNLSKAMMVGMGVFGVAAMILSYFAADYFFPNIDTDTENIKSLSAEIKELTISTKELTEISSQYTGMGLAERKRELIGLDLDHAAATKQLELAQDLGHKAAESYWEAQLVSITKNSAALSNLIIQEEALAGIKRFGGMTGAEWRALSSDYESLTKAQVMATRDAIQGRPAQLMAPVVTQEMKQIVWTWDLFLNSMNDTTRKAFLKAGSMGEFFSFLDGLVIVSDKDIMPDLNAQVDYGIVGPLHEAITAIEGFSTAREELFWGGRQGNITGALYKQVVTQGVGTLYNKQEIIVANNFYGLTVDEIVEEIVDGVRTGIIRMDGSSF